MLPINSRSEVKKTPLMSASKIPSDSDGGPSEVRTPDPERQQPIRPMQTTRPMQPVRSASKPTGHTEAPKKDAGIPKDREPDSDIPSLASLDDILGQLEMLKHHVSQRRGMMQPEATGSLNTKKENTSRMSIPKLNYVSWSTIKNSILNEHGTFQVPDTHYAIDIPLSEPTASQLTDLVSSHTTRSVGEPRISTLVPPEIYTKGDLPERICINSQRIQVILDYDLCDGSLNRREMFPFIILRPFKILFYQGNALRKRLKDFEDERLSTRSLTEKQYLEDFERNPAEDCPQLKRQNETTMELSELTGTINDLRCLIKFMDDYLLPAQTRLRNDPVYVRFSELWYVFPPGSLVIVRDKNVPQKVWKVIQRTGGRRYLSRPENMSRGEYSRKFTFFTLDCYHLDYDGVRFVPSYKWFSINEFDGTQSISSLPVYPFNVGVKERSINKTELLNRGRQFIDCTKVRHQYYSGRTHFRTPKGAKLSESASDVPASVSLFSEKVDSEVICDFERALQEVPSWRPGGDEVNLRTADICETGMESDRIDLDSTWDTRFSEDFLETETMKCQEWEKSGTCPSEDDDILLLPDRVFAFVLRSRKWACLQIGRNADGQEQLRVVKSRREPWNNLELPDGHKDLVQSLIESHFSNDKTQMHFDLVKDKGKGVIILLHGVPGVGKTSTAECAAESNNRPLLPITCGDLGLSPKEVEAKLQESFQLAQAWNCVMLLDEADIFLAQRTVTDIQRNALVSVFLRVLEYYEGILFLTTNRVGTFDEAFKSRIHVSLYYPPLDWFQTEKIWMTHIKKVTSENQRVKADHTTLIPYAENLFKIQRSEKGYGPVWNGRQIRNAFQSAIALAEFRCQPNQPIQLGQEHFEKVSKVSNDFNNYLWRVKRTMTDSDMARLGMFRDDSYVPTTSQQQLVNPNSYSQELGSVLGQNIPRGTTPAAMAGGYLPNTVAHQHPQMYAMNNMSNMNNMNGINGTISSQAPQMGFATQPVQAFGAQPQFNQPMQQQQPIFQQLQQQPQGLYNPQNSPQLLQNMQLQSQYQQQQQAQPSPPPQQQYHQHQPQQQPQQQQPQQQQQQQQQQQVPFGGMGQTSLPQDQSDLQSGQVQKQAFPPNLI